MCELCNIICILFQYFWLLLLKFESLGDVLEVEVSLETLIINDITKLEPMQERWSMVLLVFKEKLESVK